MKRIDDSLTQIETEMGESWLPRIYRERILRMRTRAYRFPQLARNALPQIHHTLLGIELKVGRHRMLCPDLATARYLSVFARTGLDAVAIPYDITKISSIADALESSWHRMLLLADELTRSEKASLSARVRRQLIVKVGREVAAAGSGPSAPEFKLIESQKGTKSAK